MEMCAILLKVYLPDDVSIARDAESCMQLTTPANNAVKIMMMALIAAEVFFAHVHAKDVLRSRGSKFLPPLD